MKICCLSDLHGHLPEVPPCDLVIIAGDLCPDGTEYMQWVYLRTKFEPWLASLPPTVYVAGNHDRLHARNPDAAHIYLPNKLYLNNTSATMGSLRIFGTPWSLKFGSWPFMTNECELNRMMRLSPTHDILITHGPPYGYGDLCHNHHTGSGAILEHIQRRQPRLVVTGHIHEGYGVYQCGRSTIVNCSLQTGEMEPSNTPILIEI